MNDEIPVGLKSNQQPIDEFPPEEHAQLDSQAPLNERLVCKSWSLRAKAFEELTASIDVATEQILAEIKENWPKFLSESNPGVLEKVLQSFTTYLKRSTDTSDGIKLLSLLIEKSMQCSKLAVRNQALECAISVCQAINNLGLVSKYICDCGPKPYKVQISVSELAVRLVQEKGIGSTGLDAASLFALAEKMITGLNSAAQKQALQIYREAYKKINSQVYSHIDKLKQNIQDTIKDALKDLLPPTIEVTVNKEVFATQEATDCLSKFNEKWCDDFNAITKWKEKKDLLDAALVSLPQDRPFDNTLQHCFVTVLCKTIEKDPNIVVINTAIKVTARIANGLRANFNSWKPIVLILLYKYKEKKHEQDINACMEQMKYSIKVQELYDDMKTILNSEKSKTLNPLIKRNTCIWMSSQIQNQELGDEDITMLGKLLVIATDDPSNEVRESAFSAISVLRSKKPSIIDKLLINMNPQKKMKIIAPNQSMKPSQIQDELMIDAKAVPSNQVSKPEHNKNDNASGEDIDQMLSNAISPSIINNLKNGQWKDKVDAYKSICTQCSQMDDGTLKDISSPLMQYIKKALKEWKESNANVMKGAMELFSLLQSKELSMTATSLISECCIEKVIDAKYKQASEDIIIKIIESTNAKNITQKILTAISNSKLQNNVKTYIMLIGTLLKTFPPKSFPIKGIIDLMKTLLTTNPAVKQPIIEVMKILYATIGTQIKTFLSDLKEPQIKMLEAEFANVPVSKEQTYKKIKEEAEEKKGGDIMDSLLPRVDISNQITQKILQMISDKEWKSRKDSLNLITAILTKANNRVEGNLNMLFNAIKPRIIDSNKAVQKGFINIIARLCEAIGPKIKQYNKFILVNLISNLSDKNSGIRQETCASLTKLSDTIGAELIINTMAPALMQDNPEMRMAGLQWILSNKSSIKSCDYKVLNTSIIQCLQDKSKPIRDLSESLIPIVISSSGNNNIFNAALQDLKPAVKNTLLPLICKNYITKAYEEEMVTEKCTEEENKATNVEQPSMESKLQIEQHNPIRNTMYETSILKEQNMNSMVRPNSLNNTDDKKMQMAALSQKNELLKNIDISTIKPIFVNMSKMKDKRSELERKNPWSYPHGIDKDSIESIKKALTGYINPLLIEPMFNPDNVMHHVECAKLLRQGLQTEQAGIIDMLDILLKWITWRLMDDNNALIKAITDFLKDMVKYLYQVSYSLYDFEAQVILSALAEKMGNYNDFVRDCCKEIILMCPQIYSISKMIPIITKVATTSRNFRSRYELLIIVKEFICRHSVDILNFNDFNTIVRQLSSKDFNYKRAIFVILDETFKQIGSECWNIFNDIDASIMNELHTKYKDIPLNSPISVSKISMTTPGRNSMAGMQKMSFTPVSMRKVAFTSNQNPECDYTKIIDEAIDKVRQNCTCKDFEPLKKIIRSMPASAEEHFVSKIAEICKITVELVNSIKISAQSSSDKYTNDLLEYTLLLSTSKKFCKNLNLDNFIALIESLLLMLLTENIETVAPIIMKSVNSIALRLMENSDTTICIKGLIRLLKNNRKNEAKNRFRALLVKCLLKINKIMKTFIYLINLSEIFVEMEDFVKVANPTEMSATNDIEIKIMKSIIFEATFIKRKKIYEDIQPLKSEASAKPSVVLSWINSTLTVLNTSTNIDDDLKTIIHELKNNGIQCCAGKLYEYIQKRPNFDVRTIFHNCSAKFTENILRELEKERLNRASSTVN